MQYYVNPGEIENIARQIKQKQKELEKILSELHSLNGELNGTLHGYRRLEEVMQLFDIWFGQVESSNEYLDTIYQQLLYIADSNRNSLAGDSTTDAPPPPKR